MNRIAELLRVNEELTTDLESKVTEVTHLMTQLSEQQEKQTHLETKHQEAQDQIVKVGGSRDQESFSGLAGQSGSQYLARDWPASQSGSQSVSRLVNQSVCQSFKQPVSWSVSK